MDRVTAGAGAGKVSMQDFHFVMRNNSSSPGLLAGQGCSVLMKGGV
jgi:type VI protein secretion system component Hcp